METGVQPAQKIWRHVDFTVSTSVIVDAMHAIHKWSFVKDTPFPDVADQYRNFFLSNLPQCTVYTFVATDIMPTALSLQGAPDWQKQDQVEKSMK